MYRDEANEQLKTIGTIALGFLLVATILGMACYHIFG